MFISLSPDGRLIIPFFLRKTYLVRAGTACEFDKNECFSWFYIWIDDSEGQLL